MRLVQSPLPVDNSMFHNGKHSIYKYTIYNDLEKALINTAVVHATQNGASVINGPNHDDNYPNCGCESLYFRKSTKCRDINLFTKLGNTSTNLSITKWLLLFKLVWCAAVLGSCIENNVCTRVTNCFHAHESVILVFISRVAKGNKHQNNTLVSPETACHECTYIILFLTRYNESINDDRNDNLYTSPMCHTCSVFVLLMTSQSIADDVKITWQLWCDHVNNVI